MYLYINITHYNCIYIYIYNIYIYIFRTLSGQSLILILNKVHIFKEKIENGTDISICKELEHIQSRDYVKIISNIEDVFRNTVKTIKSASNVFIHTVTNMSDSEVHRVSSDFVHIVISYTLAKGGIVH